MIVKGCVTAMIPWNHFIMHIFFENQKKILYIYVHSDYYFESEAVHMCRVINILTLSFYTTVTFHMDSL